MIDKVANVMSLIIIGGVAIRIVTNPHSAKTIGAVFNGFAADINASFGK